MTRPDDEAAKAAEELFRALNDAMRPVFEACARAFQGMYDALGGEEGIRQLTAALEQAKADRARWEAEHPGLRVGQMCNCLCPRWAPHECDVHADTVVPMILQGEPVPVPMCRPCARSVR